MISLIKGKPERIKVINLFVWILFGALAGWIISLLYSTSNIENSKRYILYGILGALAGGLLIQVISGASFTGFNDASVIFSVLGALVLLGAVQKFST